MIARVLVALDASPRAPSVLRMAHDVAQRFGAELFVFRAVRLPAELPPAGVALADALAPAARHQAAAELETLSVAYPLATILEPALIVGEPWRAILEAADRLHIDLVVLGSHGYAGLDHLFGTTAGQVGNRARHHVLIVHGA